MLEGTYRCLLTPCPGCLHSSSNQRPPGMSSAGSWMFGKPLGAWKGKQPPVRSPGRLINNNKASPVFPSWICMVRMSAQHKAITKPFGLLLATTFWHDPNQNFRRLTSVLNVIFFKQTQDNKVSLQTDFWPFLSRYPVPSTHFQFYSHLWEPVKECKTEGHCLNVITTSIL